MVGINLNGSLGNSSSASVGVSVNLGAAGVVGVTAGVSKGKGRSNGNEVTHSNTEVEAGDTLTLVSGNDTTLRGATASGKRVVADVGGNLNLESLQDSSSYKEKQREAGLSVTIPVTGGGFGGSLSGSKTDIKSNYRSVTEQSGIKAGDDGFQISVQGNTDLKGAVIANTQSAIDDNKNRLVTGSLTMSDIENKASYQGDSSSYTVGGGLDQGLPVLSGAGVGVDSGKANSTTVSAISQGTVTVLDDAKQQTLSGNDAKTTVALLNRDVKVDENGNTVDSQGNSTAGTLKPIFDAEKVQKELNAQVQITQAFGQQAYQAVGNYVQSERDRLRGELAGAITDEDKAAVREQLQTLETEERVMNILIAAVTGQGATAVTKEGLSLAADQMRELMIKDSLKSAGITDGETVLSNATKDSDGVRGDEFGLGGTRLDLDKLCGTGNERCKILKDENNNPILDASGKTQLELNEKGQVQWDAKDVNGNPVSLADFLDTDQGKQAAGATGGVQG